MSASTLKMSLKPNVAVLAPRRVYPSATNSRIAMFSSTISNRDPHFSFSSSTNSGTIHSNRFEPVQVSVSNPLSDSDSLTFDVVIVGAGIIGLTIARRFLLKSNLSIAVVDAAVPCAGATGAGQGYIWRVHKIPGSDKWDLAMRSHQLWEDLAETVQSQGMDPLHALGWKKTGSLLVGRTADDCSVLRRKVDQLNASGLGAEFLCRDELLSKEPALNLEGECGAAFMPDDCQIDARRALDFIQKGNRCFAAEGRYAEFYNEPATSLLRSESTGEVEAIQTSKNTLWTKKAVIIASGCWSGSLMNELLNNSEIKLDLPVKPRKGHLLVVDNFEPFQLHHGLMELGYGNHESAVPISTDVSNSVDDVSYDAQTCSVSMTATMDVSRRLVLGSSRQLVGFNTEIDESIIDRIWDRASQFFPVLKQVSIRGLSKSREVRVGLRPYMPGGKPIIGPVPGLSKMFLAAGHEGEGLSLALGTAEMTVNMVLENPQKVNPEPFAV